MSDGFTTLMSAVANAGGTLSQRSKIGFAPVVLKTLASFKTEAGAPDTTMLLLVATDLKQCEALLLGLEDDPETGENPGSKIVIVNAEGWRDDASQPVAFASLRSHVENALKTRKIPVAINRVAGVDAEPIGFSVRKIVKQ